MMIILWFSAENSYSCLCYTLVQSAFRSSLKKSMKVLETSQQIIFPLHQMFARFPSTKATVGQIVSCAAIASIPLRCGVCPSSSRAAAATRTTSWPCVHAMKRACCVPQQFPCRHPCSREYLWTLSDCSVRPFMLILLRCSCTAYSNFLRLREQLDGTRVCEIFFISIYLQEKGEWCL